MEKDRKNKKISLAEVASAAGVSKMTASRVLRNQGGFSNKTRQRVLDEVERLGYLPNRLATVFAGDKRSTFVGVSIPDLGNEIFAQVLEGIDRKLGALSHQTVLGMTQRETNEEERWIETVLSWQPAGLIVTGRAHTPRAIEMLKGSGLPVVEIWDLNSSPLDMCVGIDHFDSGYAMGRHLVGKGYQRLGYVGSSHNDGGAASARLSGFRRAVEDGGAKLVRSLVLQDVPSFYPGFFGTEQILASVPDIDAIFYQNDNLAVGGLHYCTRRGRRIPEDIGIAGWRGLPNLSVLPQQLTTIKVRHMRVGALAAEALLDALDGTPARRVIDVGFLLVPGSTT